MTASTIPTRPFMEWMIAIGGDVYLADRWAKAKTEVASTIGRPLSAGADELAYAAFLVGYHTAMFEVTQIAIGLAEPAA